MRPITLLWRISLLVSCVRADLTYYLYSEEEEQSNLEESKVIVLRSIGSLPFDKSTFSSTGDACPDMVRESGGINPKYLCAGESHTNASLNNTSSTALFPITPVNDDKKKHFLPFRFFAFTRSRGTPSGLIVWRNTLAVDSTVATSEDQPQFLDAVSMGKDTSKDMFNLKILEGEDGISNQDGQVIAEWYLLDKFDGEPIEDGGKIQLVMGKPPSTTLEKDMIEEPMDAAVEDKVTSNNDASVPAEEPLEPKDDTVVKYCSTITDTVCADDNNGKYGTLCSLMMQVGLDTMLAFTGGSEAFTLYAPTNDGFARTFLGKPPSHLSGHDLTKLLLNHLVVSQTASTEQSHMIGTTASYKDGVLRYEEMICGTKTEMANGQITKLGCDANAEVSYVLGAGNGRNNAPRPRFMDVDHQNCNGVIHTIDYVIIPGEGNPQAAPNAGVVNLVAEPEPEEPVQFTFDTTTNQLDESEVLSFFQHQKQDILEEDGPVVSTGVSLVSPDTGSTEETTTSSTAAAAIETGLEPEPDQKGFFEDKQNKNPNSMLQQDTRSEGFHAFFGRTGVQNPARPGNRQGNLRRR